MCDNMEVDGAQQHPDPNFSSFVSDDLMRIYYDRIFPTDLFYKWLAYGNDSNHPQALENFFQRREFCFTLPGDIFVRYQSFKDGSQLKQALVRRCPAKIDIGPVYNVDPQRRNAYSGVGSGFNAQERELVFDIDLSDYDDVRNCCKEGNVCKKDWPFMAAAIKILDEGLREDFGFQHILWVFSGRRGIHCWVCDQRARVMSDRERSAVAAYFTAYKGLEKGIPKFSNFNCKHPAMERALSICTSTWEQHILPEQHIFETGSTRDKIMQRITDPDIVKKVESIRPNPLQELNQQTWGVICDETEKRIGIRGGDRKAKAELLRAKEEIVLAHVYPRLDVEVSKKMNHLLKAPFCVHPKTGKVCLPIDPKRCDDFDPEHVPTLDRVVTELSAFQTTNDGTQAGWMHTSLKPHIDFFVDSFLSELKETNRAILSQNARTAGNDNTW